MNELNPEQKRTHARNEFYRKYGQHWLVYLALSFTAVLSFTSGLILPFTPDEQGYIAFTIGGVLTAIYYSVGFLANGEAAANYWFGKLTDHDKDNTTQKGIAITMLTLSVGVSLVTALAAASQIAYLMGVLTEFQTLPTWAQEWIVWSIPTMLMLHAVSGMAFKAFSDEADAERSANSVIRQAKLEITNARTQAKADYWKQNAPEIARQLGQMEAKKEIEDYSIKLQPSTRVYNSDTVNPTTPSTQEFPKK